MDLSEGEGTRRALTDQVRQAIVLEAAAAGIEAPAWPATETLWESLHRQGAELWSPRNRVVTPLLVFDQFEEVFTLGRRNPARAEETDAFLTELADLCEGSVPASVRERLEADPSAAREFSFNRHPYKILLSLREDFLPDLEGLRRRIRSIVHNRFRLRRMNGDNALRVVTQAGGHLVEPDAPGRIVRFVAGRESDSEIPLAELEIEPALLSVVCRELNNKRRAHGLPRITADLVQGNRDEILSDLYERSVGDLGPEVRSFVEERLLTKSGFRDSVALENAIELPGVTREALDTLTDRRLLRIEDRGGMQRLELTHDVLTGVIRRSRDQRREREAREREEAGRKAAERRLRRSQRAMMLLGLLLIGVVALAGWGFKKQREAREALTSSDVEKASILRDSHPARALAYLARAIRAEPENVGAQSLLTDLLLGKSWQRPRAELRVTNADSVQLSEDGRIFAAILEGGRVRLWDTQTLQRVGEVQQSNAVGSLEISRDGRRLLIVSPGTAQLWDTRTGKPLWASNLGEKSQVLLSPDGFWLALAPGDLTLVLRRVDTGREHEIRFPPYPPDLAPYGGYGNLGFSPDSRKIFAHDGLQILLWDVESGRSLPAPPFDQITSMSFSPDSRNLLVTGNGTTLWDLAAGAPVREPFAGTATHAWLSPGGKKLVTYDRRDATLRIWNTDDSKPSVEISKRDVLRADFSQNGQLLLTTSEEGVELWDAGTGRAVSQVFCDCPEGRFLADTRQIVTGDDGILKVWSADPVQAGTKLLSGQISPFISNDGELLAVRPRKGGAVRLWDLETVQPLDTTIRSDASGFWLSLDHRFLLLGGGKKLQVWDIRAGRPAWKPLPTPGGSSFRAVLNPDKAILGIQRIQREDSSIQLWSLPTGQQIGTIPPDEGIKDFAFTPGGERLVTVSSKGAVLVRDSRTGRRLGPRIDHESLVTSFDCSPDGRWIATGTGRGLVRIWDLSSGELLVGPLRHRFPVSSVRFQLEGSRLLTSARNSLKIWDARTGRPLGESIRSKGNIWFSQLSADGARLLVQSTAEPVRLLDAQTGQILVSTPFKDVLFMDVRLSPNGQLLWIANSKQVHVIAVPLFPAKDGDLLAGWAEAVGGWTFDEDDRLVEVEDQLERLNVLQRKTRKAPPGQLRAASLIRWFLSDPKTRPVSPVFERTIESSTPRPPS